MLKDLREIKEYRKKLNLTQKELSEKTGFSQSYIAKIEAGELEPTYNNAKKIFDILQNIHKHEEKKAKDFMNKKVMSLKPESKVSEAIALMKKHAISQIPIIKNNQVTGIISETAIINNIQKNPGETRVKEIMENAPPIIPLDSNRDMVIELLGIYPLLLVSDKGKISGIITKTDLFRKI